MSRIRVERAKGEYYEPKHLSYSTISGYRFCAKNWELSRVLQVEEKPGLASIGGNAVHVATEVYDLVQAGYSLEEARIAASDTPAPKQVDMHNAKDA